MKINTVDDKVETIKNDYLMQRKELRECGKILRTNIHTSHGIELQI